MPPPHGIRIELDKIATLVRPLALAVRDGDPRLYVAQKTGEVVAIRSQTPPDVVLDLSHEVAGENEQGLLGIVFSPEGRFLYVNFTDKGDDTQIVEFRMRGNRPDLESRRQVLLVRQPDDTHNGGNLVFGPDGYLWIGLGDGGGVGDPQDNAQNLRTLLGKMLRIDPRPSGSEPYGVPEDNPFVGEAGARPEVWAYGFRNPWRYSFDRGTGDLWIGDVGLIEKEEVDFAPASSRGGENYGWDRLEGTSPFEGKAPRGVVPPLHEYDHSLGTAVIGGYVYRGRAIPELRGTYVYGDLGNPELRAIREVGGRAVETFGLGVEVPALTSLGEDLGGELYAFSYLGEVYRLVPSR
jgi:glucose/arabinose dehydrogenase